MNARADWRGRVAALTPAFAARAAQLDDSDEFVAENYRELKASGLFAAGVPRELGGEGLELEQLCDMLRTMAHACSSTALAFSMHTHQVAVNAGRWRHEGAPVAPLLERVANEGAVLVTTGGADWLTSSGEAVPVDGGFRVSARKPFASGAPAGDILLTSAVVREEKTPPDVIPDVIHFAIPMSTAGVTVQPTWRAMGMRNTGSHDIVLESAFVQENAVSVHRTQGKWHPLLYRLCLHALPIIYSAYLGVAEAARERALALARKRRPDDHLLQLVGELEIQLTAARIAHADWLALAKRAPVDAKSSSKAMICRTLVARGVLGVVDAAMNVAGGAAFYRANGLERLFRDAQGARYHPLQEGPQKSFTAGQVLGN